MNITDHVYSDTYGLHTHHTDPFFTARFPFYCRVAQEGAASHALMTGCANSDLEKEGKTWVLSRFKVQVSRYITWPDTLTLETWIQPPFRLFAPREARGIDSAGREIFRSMAYWVVIDLEKRRPIRPDTIDTLIGLSEDRSRWAQKNTWIAAKMNKLPGIENLKEARSYSPQIMYRDIDSVRHINNISYIEWILESLPIEFKTDMKPVEFEIHFLAESFLDSKLTVYSQSRNDTAPDRVGNPQETSGRQVWKHVIMQQTDSGEIEACRAASVWGKREIPFQEKS
jgi:medium-chain acyl-[acyl-carrier-protein] hydrolase